MPQRRMKSTFLPVTILLLFLNLSACGPQPGRVVHDNGKIKIGYYGDLSGPTFNFGESAKNGVLMAAEEINQAGGISGRRLDIVVEDDQGSAERAATRSSKLIDADKV